MLDEPLAVLVVDDEPCSRRLMEHAVRAAFGGRAAVDGAASGEEALALLRTRSYAMVVADQQMGRISGVDLLEAARKERPEQVRILVTAHAALALAQEAISRAKVHAFLLKPLSADELRGRLHAVLQG